MGQKQIFSTGIDANAVAAGLGMIWFSHPIAFHSQQTEFYLVLIVQVIPVCGGKIPEDTTFDLVTLGPHPYLLLH